MERWSSMCATDFTAEFRETSNGRFDALLHKDNTLKSVVAAMRGLAALQQTVGRRNVPLLAVWGVDVATTAQLEELTVVTAAFLAAVRPEFSEFRVYRAYNSKPTKLALALPRYALKC